MLQAEKPIRASPPKIPQVLYKQSTNGRALRARVTLKSIALCLEINNFTWRQHFPTLSLNIA